MIQVRRTYLEMVEPCAVPLEPAPDGVLVLPCEPMRAHFYRYLYREVGQRWYWTDRSDWSDETVQTHCQDPRLFFYVLYDHGCPAGFAELEHVPGQDTQLRYFGLLPDFHGRGLGGYFLHWVCHLAHDRWQRRLWLHTCTLDSPGALPNYRARGFRPFREELYDFDADRGPD